MKKIILKSQLASRDQFEDKLSDIGLEFGPIYWQHDRIYVPRGYKPNLNYPRLIMRTDLKAVDEPPRYFLILRRHIEDSGLDIVEQTPVTDYATTVNIIMQLGFRQAGEVSRRRAELEMSPGTTIYLDEIDGLAYASFAKIESTLGPEDSVAAVKSDLQKTLEALGEHDFVNSPYFELTD